MNPTESRLLKVLQIHSFSPQPNCLVDPENQLKGPVSSGACGLYPLTALFNHECAPSAVFSTYADVMVVRARTPIKAGEEIYISYQIYELPYETRQKKLSTHFPSGSCQCQLCVEDEADGLQNRRKRLQLLEQRSSMFELLQTSSPLSARKLESWFSSLEATYSKPRPLLRSELFLPSTIMSLAYDRTGNVEKYLHYSMIALESQGIQLAQVPRKKGKSGKFSMPKVFILEGALAYSQSAVLLILRIVEMFMRRGRREEAHAWACAAFDLESIASGGGKPFFFTKYQKAFAQVGEGVEKLMKQQQ